MCFLLLTVVRRRGRTTLQQLYQGRLVQLVHNPAQRLFIGASFCELRTVVRTNCSDRFVSMTRLRAPNRVLRRVTCLFAGGLTFAGAMGCLKGVDASLYGAAE
jgi:hypothetical protein